MNDWDVYFAFFAAYTGIGVFFALPMFIPPVRRWVRAKRGRRVTAVFVYSSLIFLLLSITLSQLSAQAQVVFFCFYVGDSFENEVTTGKQHFKQAHFVTCSYEEATQLGYANEDELKRALANEFFQRSIIPPPLRQACYHPNLAFCAYIGDVSIDETPYWLTLLTYLWAPVVTGWLIWQWTKPKREESIVGGKV